MTKALLQLGQTADEFQVQTAAWITASSSGRALAGILPAQGGGPQLVATATPSGAFTCTAFAAVINGSGTTPGDFIYAQPAAQLDVLGKAPAATTARIDIAGVRVNPGSGETTLTTWQGTPSTQPVDPPLPESSYAMFRILVPANAKGLTAANVTPLWRWTALRGGVLLHSTTAQRDAIPSGYLMPGQQAYNTSTRERSEWNGTSWTTGDTGWKNLPIYSNWVSYGGSAQPPQYRVKDGIAYLRGFIKPDFISPTGTWSGTSAGNDFLTIPADARQAVDGVLCYDTRAKLTTGADTVRVDYRVMSDGSHRLWLTNDRANGAGYPFDATGWISLSGLSWPVG